MLLTSKAVALTALKGEEKTRKAYGSITLRDGVPYVTRRESNLCTVLIRRNTAEN